MLSWRWPHPLPYDLFFISLFCFTTSLLFKFTVDKIFPYGVLVFIIYWKATEK
jgi:hypothetical protein